MFPVICGEGRPISSRGPAVSHLASQSLLGDISGGRVAPVLSLHWPAVSSCLCLGTGPFLVGGPVTMRLVGPCAASNDLYCCGLEPFPAIEKLLWSLQSELRQLHCRWPSQPQLQHSAPQSVGKSGLRTWLAVSAVEASQL